MSLATEICVSLAHEDYTQAIKRKNAGLKKSVIGWPFLLLSDAIMVESLYIR